MSDIEVVQQICAATAVRDLETLAPLFSIDTAAMLAVLDG